MKKPIYSSPSRIAATKWTIAHSGGPRYFEIGTSERVLVVEDSLSRQLAFRAWLGPTGKIVRTVDAAITDIKREKFDWIFLDRDLGFGQFGEDVASHLAEIKFPGRVVVHSVNTFGAQLIAKLLADADVAHELIPFGMFGIFRCADRTGS